MKQILYVVTVALLVSGCDQVKGAIDNVMKDYGQEPAIAISPGYEINNHGHKSKVYGFSECPQSVLGSLIRETGCIIVNPDDQAVSVFIGDGEVPHQTATNEIWIVERHGEFPNNSIRFKRPDNSYVVPFEK